MARNLFFIVLLLLALSIEGCNNTNTTDNLDSNINNTIKQNKEDSLSLYTTNKVKKDWIYFTEDEDGSEILYMMNISDILKGKQTIIKVKDMLGKGDRPNDLFRNGRYIYYYGKDDKSYIYDVISKETYVDHSKIKQLSNENSNQNCYDIIDKNAKELELKGKYYIEGKIIHSPDGKYFAAAIKEDIGNELFKSYLVIYNLETNKIYEKIYFDTGAMYEIIWYSQWKNDEILFNYGYKAYSFNLKDKTFSYLGEPIIYPFLTENSQYLIYAVPTLTEYDMDIPGNLERGIFIKDLKTDKVRKIFEYTEEQHEGYYKSYIVIKGLINTEIDYGELVK